MVVVLHHSDFISKHPTCNVDNTGEMHQEAGDRISGILEALQSGINLDSSSILLDETVPLATDSQILAVHEEAYLLSLKSQTERASTDVSRFSPLVVNDLEDKEYIEKYKRENLSAYSATRFSKSTLRCARRAAGAVIKAVEIATELLSDPLPERESTKGKTYCFALIRPPGHHSTTSGIDKKAGGCGFCIFNNVCVGAAHVLNLRPESRILIFDFDVHHGNGTQEIVVKRFKNKNVLYISLHLLEVFDNPDQDFFPGSGKVEENGLQILNVPLSPLWVSNSSTKKRKISQNGGGVVSSVKSGREGFRQAISKSVCPRIATFKPSLAMFSAGFDGALSDEGSTQDGKVGLDLAASDFGWMTKEIVQACRASNPTVSVVSALEGGYGRWDSSLESYDRTSLISSCMEHIRSLVECENQT